LQLRTKRNIQKTTAVIVETAITIEPCSNYGKVTCHKRNACNSNRKQLQNLILSAVCRY